MIRVVHVVRKQLSESLYIETIVRFSISLLSLLDQFGVHFLAWKGRVNGSKALKGGSLNPGKTAKTRLFIYRASLFGSQRCGDAGLLT